MDYLIPIITGICLSACTGFRAFLPPFIVGLLHRFIPQAVMLFPGLSFLGQTPVLITLGIAVLVEFLGDKIPWIDHILDVLELPIKSLVGFILTYLIVPGGDYSWIFLLFALVIGGGTTLTVHTGKSGLRMASSVSTGGAANPVLSLLEDALAFLGTLFAIFLPLFALGFLTFVLWRSVRFLSGPRGGNSGKIALGEPSMVVTHAMRVLMRVVFGVFNRLEAVGRENIPVEPPYVLVANHASMADGFILGCIVPRPTFFMVKKEAFENPVVGWYLRKVMAFPIDREHPDPTSIKLAFKILQEKEVLTLFPEGTRSPNGLLRPFKAGAIKIAIRQKVKIVPVYIADSHLISPPGTWFPRPVKLRINFGVPIDPVPLLERGLKDDEIQNEVFAAVCRLGSLSTGRKITDLVEAPPSQSGHVQEISASA